MARLDRLAAVKEVAQLGATFGRTFSYELLQAVTPLDDAALQQALAQLVAAELLYQRGVPPQATLSLQARPDSRGSLSVAAQEHPAAVASAHCAGVGGAVSGDPGDPTRTAGVSLHRSRAQPASYRLLAAGWGSTPSSARPTWKRSNTSPGGWSCWPRSPETPARDQQDLDLQIALAPGRWLPPRVHTAPEVEQTYARARALCASRSARRLSSSRRSVGLMAILPEPGSVGDGAGTGGTALRTGAA